MSVQALPYILLLSFFFGTALISSRIGVGQFHPVTYIGLRTLLASLGYGAVFIFSSRRRKWPSEPRIWRHSAVLGLFGTAIPMVFFVTALQYLSAGVAAILITVGPAVTVIFAHFFLTDENLSLRKGIGVILALAGTLLIAIRGENGLPNVTDTNPLGYILIILALIMGSGMNVYSRKHMRHYDSFEVASIRTLVAMLVVMSVTVLFVGIDLKPVTSQGYMALLYGALAANFLGMFLAFHNVKHFGATAAAMSDYLVPVVAVAGGVLILGEQLTAGMLVGMAFVVAGIALINRRGRPANVHSVRTTMK
ncbi:MAG: DMT family transporter [Chloroflexota bacterium]|nr:DMT family transporter [Chloroflexota bacterium]